MRSHVAPTAMDVVPSLTTYSISSSEGVSTPLSDDGTESDIFFRCTFEDDYEFGTELFSGESSIVCRVRSRATGEWRAAKIRRTSPSNLKLVENEHKMLRSIRHAHIVRIYGAYKGHYAGEDALFVVMELAPCGALFEVIVVAGNLVEAQARRVIWQALDALAYLRDACIVHRDLKPENLLVMAVGSDMLANSVTPVMVGLSTTEGNGTLSSDTRMPRSDAIPAFTIKVANFSVATSITRQSCVEGNHHDGDSEAHGASDASQLRGPFPGTCHCDMCGASDAGTSYCSVPVNLTQVLHSPFAALAPMALTHLRPRFLDPLAGSPTYAAPEMLVEGGHGYGCPVDVFSLGIVLFVCLAGTLPNDRHLRQHGLVPATSTTDYSEPLGTQHGAGSGKSDASDCAVRFTQRVWKHVSSSAKALIQGMTTIDPRQRLTIAAAMAHPWFAPERAPKVTTPRPQASTPMSTTGRVIGIEDPSMSPPPRGDAAWAWPLGAGPFGARTLSAVLGKLLEMHLAAAAALRSAFTNAAGGPLDIAKHAASASNLDCGVVKAAGELCVVAGAIVAFIPDMYHTVINGDTAQIDGYFARLLTWVRELKGLTVGARGANAAQVSELQQALDRARTLQLRHREGCSEHIDVAPLTFPVVSGSHSSIATPSDGVVELRAPERDYYGDHHLAVAPSESGVFANKDDSMGSLSPPTPSAATIPCAGCAAIALRRVMEIFHAAVNVWADIGFGIDTILRRTEHLQALLLHTSKPRLIVKAVSGHSVPCAASRQ